MAKQKNEEPEKFQPPSIVQYRSSAVAMSDVAGAFVEASGETGIDKPSILPLIKIDHKAECFSISGNQFATIEGYVIHHFQTRAWYKNSYVSGSHDPPDCSSSDMLRPSAGCENIQAERCSVCKRAVFGGGATGRGQECKTRTFVFILNPQLFFPAVHCLVLPVSSLVAFCGSQWREGYIQRASQFRGGKENPVGIYQLVWGRFTLERGGDLHSVVSGEPVSICPTAEEGVAIARLRADMMAAFDAMHGVVGTSTEEEFTV